MRVFQRRRESPHAVCFAIFQSSACERQNPFLVLHGLHAIGFCTPNYMRVLYVISLVVQDGWKFLFDFLFQFFTKILTCFFVSPCAICLKMQGCLFKNLVSGINTSCEESTGPPLVLEIAIKSVIATDGSLVKPIKMLDFKC